MSDSVKLPNAIDEKSFDESGSPNLKVNTLISTPSVSSNDVELLVKKVTTFVSDVFADPTLLNTSDDVKATIKLINNEASSVITTVNSVMTEILDDNRLDITEVPKLVLLVSTLVNGDLKVLISGNKLQVTQIISLVEALVKGLIEKALVIVENNEQVSKLFQSSVALLKGASNIKNEVSKIEEFIVNVFTGKDIDTNKLNLDSKVVELIKLINKEAKSVINLIKNTVNDVLHDGKLDSSDVPKLVLLITTLMNSELKNLLVSGKIQIDDIVNLIKSLLKGLIDNSLIFVDNADSMFKLFDASLELLKFKFEVPSVSSLTACCAPIFTMIGNKKN
jgi:hypothetical protein